MLLNTRIWSPNTGGHQISDTGARKHGTIQREPSNFGRVIRMSRVNWQVEVDKEG